MPRAKGERKLEILKALAQMPKLSSLSVEKTKVTAEGVKAIKAAKPGLTVYTD